MIALLRLCRLYYGIPLSYAYVLTVCYALGDRLAHEWLGILLSSTALTLVISAAYVFNDVLDINVDRINAPTRPIAAGQIQPRTATIWAGLLLGAGMAMAARCRGQFVIGLALLAVGLMVYDLVSKRLGPFKQVTVALLTTAIYPLAIAQADGATGRRVATLLFFPIWLFLTALAYEGFKDIRDMTGDGQVARSPTWIQRRPRLANGCFRSAAVLGGLALIAPALTGCGWVYASMIWAAILAAAVSASLPPRKALTMVYIECVIVGLAATADLIVLGG